MRTVYEERFINLVKDNQQRILRICRAYATSEEDQKDLFQEVLFQAWKSLPGFKEKAHINTWLYKIALNVCLRHSLQLNIKKKSERVMENTFWIRSENLASDTLAVEKADRIGQLYGCIAGLNPADKSIILLFLEEMAYRDIAEITGLSENNVAQKISRIKKKLTVCLQQKEQ